MFLLLEIFILVNEAIIYQFRKRGDMSKVIVLNFRYIIILHPTLAWAKGKIVQTTFFGV